MLNFKELYRYLEGMELREMDQILDPVYILCRDHERAGFVESVKIGLLLALELENAEQGGRNCARLTRCSGRAEIATLRPERNDQSCQREIANSPGW